MTEDARSTARQAGHHPVVEKGARLGYAANGLINLVIGWIALQLALGSGTGGEQASASGALRTLAEQPFGAVLLWVILAGFVLLGLWQAVSAFLDGETKERVKAAAKAVTYLVLAGLTWTIVGSSGGGSGGGSAGLTATLMQQPFGRVLVALVGVGVAAVGVYHAIKGWTKKFLQDLQERPDHWVVVAGRAGYIARGIALVVVGGLFVTAAWTADPQEAQGLDGALQAMLQVPFGRVLLGLVALGFVAYGVYSFARAKYADI
ncbi:DUF1206 domain-containing protein [uncultured Cellulomonas sp.]|uniref:DUF1206 domain-containing protein n=1 Tax=uncultured Cellulomonas sp. TaxID=189682 RepID=UPI00260C5BB8|nr:DUF1206 domain-containing protein [uncultured Cellulomonas sp.]